jgi:hypothetical protein
MAATTSINDVRASLARRIQDLRTELAQYQEVERILMSVPDSNITVKKRPGRPSGKSQKFLIETVKRGPGRPKGSVNRTAEVEAIVA